MRDTQLGAWFEQFRDLGVLAVALSGGALTLFGTVMSGATRQPSSVLGIVLLCAAAVTALIGQSTTVDAYERDDCPLHRLQRLRRIAMALLGAGAGSLLVSALRALP